MSPPESANETHEPDVATTIARALTSAMKSYYGKGPVSARAHFVEDDILLAVMRDPATTAERSMASQGRARDAREFRLAFEDQFSEELTGIVEKHTGRKVATYHSQIVFDPDLLFEIFVFEK